MRGRELLTIVVVFLAVLGMATAVWAADSREFSNLVRQAERLYFNGKADEADVLLKQAEEAYTAIMQGDDAQEQGKVRRQEAKLKNIRKNIDRKLGNSADGTVTTPQPASPGAKTAASGDELPSYVASQLVVAGRYLDNAQQHLDNGQMRNAERQLRMAVEQMEKIEDRYSKYQVAEHPDMLALQSRQGALQAALGEAANKEAQAAAQAAEAAEKAQAASEIWIAKLRPYATGMGQPGHDPENYFIGSYTADEQELARRTANYSKVKVALAEYEATGPGENATDELQQMVKDLRYQIQTFDESCANMATSYVDEAQRQLTFMTQRVDEQLTKIGSGEVLPLAQDRFTEIRRPLDRAAGLLGEDDPRVVSLNKELESLAEKNGKLIAARISESRMFPDVFSGSEKEAIKEQAQQVLAEKFPGIEALRTTVISPDWKEESVIEWTDTTKTALQHRVTRSVSAQISGKQGGETRLYTIYIGKNRRTDGSWGTLHGHLMFTDPILEENVNK